MDANEATRVRQGASATTSPEILRALANDPSVTVRASLALNPALPEQVNAILAGDTDARVRAILNRKLSMLTPNLDDANRQQVQRNAVANLTAMVAEAALRVRIGIADAVKELSDGPRDIVLRLAHDPEVMVCGPVLRFSPMLTQEDLIALIATKPPPSTILAVAERPRIDPSVSDAVVGTADSTAIRALLNNPTAQIREATLDSLAAQSEEHTDWQAPLVRRPHLPPRAQRMLAEIVTGNLLEVLRQRRDLDPKVAQMVQAALKKAEPESQASTRPGQAPPTSYDIAQTLHKNGGLDDTAILDAIRRNAHNDAAAMLAVKADVRIGVVDRVCALRSAKGMVSLAWKAGLKVQTAVVLQIALANLPPDTALRPGADGGFPLSEDEMRWQLAFLDIPDRPGTPWKPRRLAEQP